MRTAHTVCARGVRGSMAACYKSIRLCPLDSDIESYSTEAEYVEILEDVHEVLSANLINLPADGANAIEPSH